MKYILFWFLKYCSNLLIQRRLALLGCNDLIGSVTSIVLLHSLFCKIKNRLSPTQNLRKPASDTQKWRKIQINRLGPRGAVYNKELIILHTKSKKTSLRCNGRPCSPSKCSEDTVEVVSWLKWFTSSSSTFILV